MMPIENQVCSLNLAKLLKEFGCKQESLFYYIWTVAYTDGNQRDFEEHWEIVYKKPESKFYRNIYSAFTVAELIDMVEKYSNEWAVGYDDSGCFYRFVRGERGCGSMLEGFGGKSRFSSIGDEETFVDAFAQWVIYLLVNNLMGKERG